MVGFDQNKGNVKDITNLYASAIIENIKPKTYIDNKSNGTGSKPTATVNYTHGFLVDDLEEIQNNLKNSNLHIDNHNESIPNLFYQYDSTTIEINNEALIPIIVKSIQNSGKKIENLQEDIMVVLITNFDDPSASEYKLLKTKEEILLYLSTTIANLDESVFQPTTPNSKTISLKYDTIILDNNNVDTQTFVSIISEDKNKNSNIQEVRVSNERKNNILKSLISGVIKSNNTIDKDYKLYLDLRLLPKGPSTNVITRELANPLGEVLVRFISAYAIYPEILTRRHIINEDELLTDDRKVLIGMNIGDDIQLVFQYEDIDTDLIVEKNLLYIKKTNDYTYDITELDSNTIITDKEEVLTHQVTIEYNDKTFTYYYVLGSTAGYCGNVESISISSY